MIMWNTLLLGVWGMLPQEMFNLSPLKLLLVASRPQKACQWDFVAYVGINLVWNLGGRTLVRGWISPPLTVWNPALLYSAIICLYSELFSSTIIYAFIYKSIFKDMLPPILRKLFMKILSMQWYVLIRYKTYIWGGVLSSECLPNCNCKHCIYYQHPYYEFSFVVEFVFVVFHFFLYIAIDSLVFLLYS